MSDDGQTTKGTVSSTPIAADFASLSSDLAGMQILAAQRDSRTIYAVDIPQPIPLELSALIALSGSAGPDVAQLLPFDASILNFRLASLDVATAHDTDALISFDALLVVYAGDDKFHWDVLPDFLSLSEIELYLTWEQDTEHEAGGEVLSSISAVADLAGLSFAASFGWAAGFRCRLLEPSEVAVSDLLQTISDDAIHLPDVADFTLAGLDFEYKPHLQRQHWLLNLDGHWSLFGDALVLESVMLEYGASHGDAVVKRVSGELAIADTLHFIISADYLNPGWQFEGQSVHDEPIPIGHVIAAIAHAFGVDGSFYAVLDGLAFENLDLFYNSADGNFTFSGEMKLKVEGEDVDITLSVMLTTPPDSDDYSKEIVGHMTIGGEEFTVTFDAEEVSAADANSDALPDSTSTYAAAYAHEEGHGDPPHIRDLVAQISPAIAELTPDITTPKAVFGYQRAITDGKKSSKWLFAVEFGASIDVGANSPALPIVGKLNFKLDALQTTLVKQAFSSDELGHLPMEGFTLPAAGIEDTVIATTLLLDGEEHPVLITLGGKKSSSSPASDDTDDDAAENGATAPPAVTDDSSQAAVQPDAERAGSIFWISLQKEIGPIHFQKIGVSYNEGRIGLALDIAMTTSGLTLSLQGLVIDSPIDEFDPRLHLAGIGIEYDGGGAVHIGGTFLAVDRNGVTEYGGSALIQAETFTLAAMGAYQDGDDPSLFVSAFLDYPLGGPGFFYVTGLAGGFGYNRSLRLPTLDQLPDFPMIKMAMGTGLNGNGLSGLSADDLSEYIASAPGQDWFSVGVRFTSYEMVQSFAMLTVSFGVHFELSILGLSRMSVPTGEEHPVAYTEVALSAVFRPDEGILRVDAKLTAASYVFSTDAKLTGGFAFYIWFNDDDFVISFGGYHPHFIKPAQYPDVERLALTWQVNDQLVIKGSAYFALTPAAIMAGGGLSAVWEDGGLRAWYEVSADFLIYWKPFHYEIQVHINIGASFTIDLLFTSITMTIHVGVDLDLWGPPFGGVARVDLSIISFSVSFGAGKPTPPKLSWDQFATAFLPHDKNDGLQIFNAQVSNGLVKDRSKEMTTENPVRWLINPLHLEITTSSAIPIKNAKIGGEAGAKVTIVDAGDGDVADLAALGISPVGATPDKFESTYTVTLKKDGADANTSIYKTVEFTLIRQAAAKAMWTDPSAPEDLLSADATIPGAIHGLRISAAVLHPSHTKAVKLRVLEFGSAPFVTMALNISPPKEDAASTAAAMSKRASILTGLFEHDIKANADVLQADALPLNDLELYHPPRYRSLG